MSIQLTRKQEEGLKTALERWRNNEKYTVISGYAGTGKSTLVKFIIEAIDVEPSKVAYTSYTGKAAEVLRKKGNPNAMTLHKLLYDSFPREGGGFYRKPKTSLEYDIIIADEVSMIPKSMIDLLMKHKVYVLFLGDPFQLPQIEKKEEHNLLVNPHVFLDEIMRQEAESEIIQLTMKIRNYENIDYFKGKEVQVIPKSELVTGHLTWADQVICGTNNTRHTYNQQMRKLYGYNSDIPQNGEKLICLRNYWDELDLFGVAPLVNGTTGIINNPFESFTRVPNWIQCSTHQLNNITGDFVTDDGTFPNIMIDKEMILTGATCLDLREAYRVHRYEFQTHKVLVPYEFAFGYCITCHKSQGSEWPKVTVIEERFPFDKKEHARWLYTAATRASEKLVLVR